jgi:hypothetical protein
MDTQIGHCGTMTSTGEGLTVRDLFAEVFVAPPGEKVGQGQDFGAQDE